jgi:hypothetical protein
MHERPSILSNMTRTIECPVCRGTYKSEKSLAAHVARFHGGTRPEKPMDAVVSEVDGYFKQWADGQKLAREKLGEVPLPRPINVPTPAATEGVELHVVQEPPEIDLSKGEKFTHAIRDPVLGLGLSPRDFDAPLYGVINRGKDMFMGKSRKRHQRQMIATMVATMILMVPCAYYVAAQSGLFIGITPFIVTPETPTSFEDVRDIEVVDAATEDDISGFVANFTLCTVTEPADWLTYHVVIQSPNMTAILVELREYAYTPASFHVFLHVEFDSTYASTWAELVPMTHIYITCFEV